MEEQINEQKQNDNKEIKDIQNEENEEENYTLNKELMDRIYSKSNSFKNIFKLNHFCRTIRILLFILKRRKE